MEYKVENTRIGDKTFSKIVPIDGPLKWKKLAGPETWPQLGQRVIVCRVIDYSIKTCFDPEPNVAIISWSLADSGGWTHWAEINLPE